jgi:hypothetical protein
MEGEMKKKADTPEIVSADDAVPGDKYAAKAINYLKNKTVMTMNGDTPVNFSSDNTSWPIAWKQQLPICCIAWPTN